MTCIVPWWRPASGSGSDIGRPLPSLTEGTQPDNLLPPVYARPGYYVVAAVVLRPFLGASLETQFYLLRALSALMSLGFGGVLARAGARRLSSVAGVGVGVRRGARPAADAHLPRAPRSTATHWPSWSAPRPCSSWCGACEARPSARRVLVLAAIVAVGLLVKRTLVFLAPLFGVWLLLVWTQEAARRRWRLALALGIGLALLAVAAFAWRGATAGSDWPFPGRDPTSSVGMAPDMVSRLWSADTWSPRALLMLGVNLCLTLASFWGNFGWLTLPLPPGVYILLAIVTTLGIVGACRAALRGWRGADPARRRLWALPTAAAGLAVGQLLALAVVEGIMQQGRYLLPVVGCIALLLVRGWAEWFPAARRRPVAIGIAVGMAALAVGCWVGVILPAA